MADIVSALVRSRMMAGIRSTDTKPEMVVRRGLHAMGFRYRLHDRRLHGTPDLVFQQYNAVLFVHGCFWHGHNCHLFRAPKTRTAFWEAKIADNRERDRVSIATLIDERWRVGAIWECALKGRQQLPLDDVLRECAAWLTSSRSVLEIRGF